MSELTPVPESLPESNLADLGRWLGLIENHTGVQVFPGRDAYVEKNIQQRLQELGGLSASKYFKRLGENHSEPERRLILDRLLIKETRFFRHRDSLNYLARVASAWLARGNKTLNAWSVGCATGEEAYSVAMAMMAAYVANRSRPRFGVVGTDISHSSLDYARIGQYRQSQLKELSDEEQRQYFNNSDRGLFEVAGAIKKRVCFLHHNILNAPEASFARNCDVIFCQNVLIYFKRWRRKQIVHKLAENLKPGGRLILGPGEFNEPLPGLLTRDYAPGVLAYIRNE